MKHLLILICFLLPASLAAETPDEIAQQGLRAFQANDFEEAIQSWEDLVSLGFVNVPNYFNLANAYWRAGKPGQARRYLLKARHLGPRNSDIRNNLAFLEQKLGVPQPANGSLQSLLRRVPWWRATLSYYELFFTVSGLSVLLFFYLSLAKIRKKSIKKSIVIPLGLVCVLAVSAWGFRFYEQYGLRQGVIIATEVPLLSAPSQESLVGQVLREGELVDVERYEGKFFLVTVPDGKKYWVQKELIGLI